MKAVVLAGSEGRGLKPLTSTMAEPLVPLLGKPVLFWTLDGLRAAGCREVLLLLRDKATEILSHFPDGKYNGMQVNYAVEEETAFTVGSLKNAWEASEETVFVIDCGHYREFDLERASAFHAASGNAMTLLLRRDGQTYFDAGPEAAPESVQSGTKHFENALYASEETDAGAYFLEAAALRELPEEIRLTRKRELIAALRKRGMQAGVRFQSEYACPVTEFSGFRQVQFDMLDGNTSYVAERVAEGVYTASTVPTGDYVLIPPVWLGEGVQIESGAVLGPYAIIEDGCLVSQGAKVRESVVFANVYLSKGCSINGAILCEGVSVKRRASVFEGAVIGENTIIGEDAVVGNGVMIWPGKTIENGAIVTENIKYSSPEKGVPLLQNRLFGDFGIELTPEKTARFGAALGSLADGIRIGVGIDGQANALSLKCGILGGLISVGAKSFDFGKCFHAQMFYFSAFCALDIAVYIGGGEDGVSISLYGSGGVSISRAYSRKIEQLLRRSEFRRCAGGDCQSVSVMNGMAQMYINALVGEFGEEKLTDGISLICAEPMISKAFSASLQRIGAPPESESSVFRINNDGTRLSIVQDSLAVSHEKLLALVAYDRMKAGEDVALSREAPEILTGLARSMGRRIYRVGEDDAPVTAAQNLMQGLCTRQLWSRDALFLAFRVLSILRRSGKSLGVLLGELPDFYLARKIIEVTASPVTIAKHLTNKSFRQLSEDEVMYSFGNANAKVQRNPDGKSFRILTEAVTAEAAEELCAEVGAWILSVNDEITGSPSSSAGAGG